MSSALKPIVAFVVLAAVWWSMAELALSTDVVQSGVRDVILHSPFQDSSLDLIQFDAGYCCEDFNAGLALSTFVTAFSAIPMALAAFTLTRTRSIRYLPAITEFARAALFLQGASIALNLLFAWFWFSDGAESFYSPWGWILFGGVIAGIATVPAWYRLSQRTGKPAPEW